MDPSQYGGNNTNIFRIQKHYLLDKIFQRISNETSNLNTVKAGSKLDLF